MDDTQTVEQFDIIAVHWNDAVLYPFTVDMSNADEAAKLKPSPTRTVGFVLVYDDAKIVLADSWLEAKRARNATVIPRDMVIDETWLARPTPPGGDA